MGMNTLFDRDYRALNQSELIYKVTNRREFSKQENMTFEEVLSSHSHHGKADESSDTHHFLHIQNDPADASYPQMYHPLFHGRSVCLLTLFQMHLPMHETGGILGGFYKPLP